MKNDLTGKTVFLSGATSGIGEATARAFADEGCHLVLTARKEKALNTLAKDLEKRKVNVETFIVDLTDTETVSKMFSQIIKMDIAVNNAGFEGKIGDVSTLSLKDFDDVMNINVRSLWWCMKNQIAWFRKHKQKGNIINISSIAGIIGIPTSSLYVASKHAVEGLTKSLALEQIGNGVRINAVAPGGVRTTMLERVYDGDLKTAAKAHPIGRIAEPSEIAQTILWLASEKSSYVVGHSLVADGGRTV